MGSLMVPTPLRERLGDPASAALLDMFDVNSRSVAEDVVSRCCERFERRLVEETSRLRVDMAQFRSDVRDDLGSLRVEMGTHRVELLRWAFLFWVGQFVSVVAVVGLMLRMTGR